MHDTAQPSSSFIGNRPAHVYHPYLAGTLAGGWLERYGSGPLPVDEVVNPVDEVVNPVDEVVNPVDEVLNPVDEVLNPVDGLSDA